MRKQKRCLPRPAVLSTVIRFHALRTFRHWRSLAISALAMRLIASSICMMEFRALEKCNASGVFLIPTSFHLRSIRSLNALVSWRAFGLREDSYVGRIWQGRLRMSRTWGGLQRCKSRFARGRIAAAAIPMIG